LLMMTLTPLPRVAATMLEQHLRSSSRRTLGCLRAFGSYVAGGERSTSPTLAFEPFPKSADLPMKHAVHPPPASPRESPALPRRGFRILWPAMTLGSPPVRPGFAGRMVPVERRPRMGGLVAPPVKPFWPARETPRKQKRPNLPSRSKYECGDGKLPQPDLSRIPEGRDNGLGREAVTDVVTVLLVFLSLSVLVAHAFDAYRAP
jgi:hypothetical protein